MALGARKFKLLCAAISKSYKDACDLLTHSRLVGEIEWGAVSDGTRPMIIWDCHPNAAPFVRTLQELAGHLKPELTGRYSHCRLYDLTGAVGNLPNLVLEISNAVNVPFA